MSGSNLYLPRHLRNAQMSKAVVFWWNKKADFIMCPPSPIAPPPSGFEKIECRHAHEVDSWSARLRLQEKRIREMSEYERFEYEGRIQSDIIAEMEACYARSTDALNREFMAINIKKAKETREKRKMEMFETYMHAEAKEGVIQ